MYQVQVKACDPMFDLSSSDYIVNIPLAWETTEMSKRLEKNGITL